MKNSLLRPLHTTTETTKKVVIVRTHTVLYMSIDFHSDLFWKNRCENICSFAMALWMIIDANKSLYIIPDYC